MLICVSQWGRGWVDKTAACPVCPGIVNRRCLGNVILDEVSLNLGIKQNAFPVLLWGLHTILAWAVCFLQKQRPVNIFSQLHIISTCILLISYCPIFTLAVKGSVLLWLLIFLRTAGNFLYFLQGNQLGSLDVSLKRVKNCQTNPFFLKTKSKIESQWFLEGFESFSFVRPRYFFCWVSWLYFEF